MAEHPYTSSPTSPNQRVRLQVNRPRQQEMAQVGNSTPLTHVSVGEPSTSSATPQIPRESSPLSLSTSDPYSWPSVLNKEYYQPLPNFESPHTSPATSRPAIPVLVSQDDGSNSSVGAAGGAPAGKAFPSRYPYPFAHNVGESAEASTSHLLRPVTEANARWWGDNEYYTSADSSRIASPLLLPQGDAVEGMPPSAKVQRYGTESNPSTSTNDGNAGSVSPVMEPAAQSSGILPSFDESPFISKGDGPSDFLDPDFNTGLLVKQLSKIRNVRGWSNVIVLFLLTIVLAGLYIGLPVGLYLRQARQSQHYHWLEEHGFPNTGPPSGNTVPLTPQLRPYIDPDTPTQFLTRAAPSNAAYSTSSEPWKLIFSDEFNEEGRSFYPGDDEFWEAVDLHYWLTNDYEWYHPSGATTSGGNLVLTLSNTPRHDLQYTSGMIQSWNKFCFTGGYFEANISLPGPPTVAGFWPGVWTLGNLGRAGYGATTDGVWPYTYDTCDGGALPNMSYTMPNYLSGQRLSKCVCPGPDVIAGVDHPSPGIGRGAPEIDALEGAGNDKDFGGVGSASQSYQIAPFDYNLKLNQSGITVSNTGGFGPSSNVPPQNISALKTLANPYTGGLYQQAASYLTGLDTNAYDSKQFQTVGFEYLPSSLAAKTGRKGYIRWFVAGVETWRLDETAMGPNALSKVAQRLISDEPMSIILNFGMSDAFGKVDFQHLSFPASFLIDYVRVYQDPNLINIGCNPAGMESTDYIYNHWNAYQNPNLTTWEQAGYDLPSSAFDLSQAGKC